MKQLKKQQLKKEAKNFSVVGVISTVMDYILLNFISLLFHVPPVPANIISTTTTSVVSYKLNKRVVFEGRRHSKKRTVLLYVLVIGTGIYIIQNTVIYLLAHRMDEVGLGFSQTINSFFGTNIPASIVTLNISKACGGCLAGLWNFLMLRHFVFIPETKKEELQPAQ